MRRSVLNALATVSLAALVSVATSSQAVTPASLGTLKQLDKWRVGIVDPEGQSFCAMVNKFDSNVGLAFALSPDGYGSVAIDVSTAQFAPGETYQVALSANGQKAGTFAGRATSPRSVVVQVGQNTKFYDALKSNAALGVGLPQLDAEFTLAKFAPSYRQLVDCAATLNTGVSGKDGKMPAVKVKSVEKAVLAPLDRELAAISGKAADVAFGRSAGGETGGSSKSAEGKPADKAAVFDDVETALETETAPARTEVARTEVKWDEPATPAATPEIGGQKPKTAAEQAQPAPRVMLVSTKTPTTPVPAAADSGATAKLWDESQAQAKKAAAETKAVEQASAARIAVLEAVKNETAQQQVAAYSQQKLELDTKVVTLQKQVQVTEAAKTSAPRDKALKASLVAKQAEIARISAERVQQTQALTQKLATTQNTYQSQITSVAAERDALKKQLAAAQSEAELSKARAAMLESKLGAAAVAQADRQKMQALESRAAFLESKLNSVSTQQSSAEKARLQQLETKLAQAEQQRLSLEGQLNTVGRQTKLLGATLGQKQKQLETTAASSKDIDAIRAETARMQASNAAIIEKLQKQLASQKAQYEGLQGEYAELHQQGQAVLAKADAGVAKQQAGKSELSRKEAYVSDLERKVAALEADRAAAAASAEKAQVDLAAARRDSSSARKSLIIINDDELPVSLVKKQPVADAGASSEEAAALKKQLAIAQSDADFNRARAALLETKLKTASAAQSDVSADKQKVQELEADAASLQQKLEDTSTAQAGKPSVEQEQAINDQRAKLEAAHAEISRLKEGNAELAEKLSETASAEPQTAIEPAMATELASYRQRVVELEARLSEAQTAQRALPAPVARPSFVSADAVIAEDLSPVISPRPSRKPVRTAAVEPAEVDVTREILGMEPAAGDEGERVPVLSRKLIENAGEIRPAPVLALRRLPAAPVAAAPARDPGFNTNRAAAFLDRIMSHHRPGGAKKAPVEAEDTSSVFSPVRKEAPARFIARTPVVTAPVIRAPVPSPEHGLSAIETAAGPEPLPRGYSAKQPAAAPEMIEEDIPAPIVAAPVREVAPQPVVQEPVAVAVPAPAPSSGRSGIENLLARAGIHDAAFTAAEHESGNAVVRQWTAGGISGMYEQLPAQGSFAANTGSYIERYREDCPALEVSMGATERTSAGNHAMAEISCPTAGNTYSTSFVFWQDSQYFSAVLHSGYPADAGKVRGLAASIVSALGGTVSQPAVRAAARPVGLSPRAEVRQAEAVTAPIADDRPQLRFNIRQEPSAAYSGGASFGQPAFSPAPSPSLAPVSIGGDFETVVIE